METVRTLEKQLVEINKGLPKLPKGLTKWLADYGWLLVLIGVVLSVLSLFTVVPALLTALGILSLVGAQYGIFGYGLDLFGWLSAILSIVNLLIVIYLEAVAISPLKDKKYRGWELIFIASLVSITLGAIGSIITLALGSLLVTLVFYAIGLYFLFQVREHFAPHALKEKVVTTKPEFKAPVTEPKK
ncbi:hypothetical protein I8H83_00180 [Candidatus Saccharibacteria bacterium]|nr:hypothetical protein [Candidatus Saccharibacteria bacterium]